MAHFLTGLIEISLAMSAIIIALLLFARFFGRRYLAGVRYAAWLLVALRLVIPLNATVAQPVVSLPTPSLSTVTVTQRPAVSQAPLPEPSQATTTQQPVQPSPLPQAQEDAAVSREEVEAQPEELDAVPEPLPALAPTVDLWALALGIYLAGALAVLAIAFWKNHKLHVYLRRWRYLAPERLQEKGPAVYVVPGLAGPMATGLLRPGIYLPEKEYQPETLRMILLHERTHCRNRDLWGRLLLLLATAVHWFNPLVHLMSRRAEQDMEQRCDEQVKRVLSEEERLAYGQAILEAMLLRRGVGAPLTTAFRGDKQAVAARLFNLMEGGSRRGAAVIVALALCVGSLAALVSCSPGADVREENLEAVLTELYRQPDDVSRQGIELGLTDGDIEELLSGDYSNPNLDAYFEKYVAPYATQAWIDRARSEGEMNLWAPLSSEITMTAIELEITPADTAYTWVVSVTMTDKWGQTQTFVDDGDAQFDAEGRVQLIQYRTSPTRIFALATQAQQDYENIVAQQYHAADELMNQIMSPTYSQDAQHTRPGFDETFYSTADFASRENMTGQLAAVFGRETAEVWAARLFDGERFSYYESDMGVLVRPSYLPDEISWGNAGLTRENAFRVISYSEEEITFAMIGYDWTYLISSTSRPNLMQSYAWHEGTLVREGEHYVFQYKQGDSYFEQTESIPEQWMIAFERHNTPAYQLALNYFAIPPAQLSALYREGEDYALLLGDNHLYRATVYGEDDGASHGALLVVAGELPNETLLAAMEFDASAEVTARRVARLLLDANLTDEALDISEALNTMEQNYRTGTGYGTSGNVLTGIPLAEEVDYLGFSFTIYRAGWELVSGDVQPPAELWDSDRGGWQPGATFRPPGAADLLLLYDEDNQLVYSGLEPTQQELVQMMAAHEELDKYLPAAQEEIAQAIAHYNSLGADVAQYEIIRFIPVLEMESQYFSESVVAYSLTYRIQLGNPDAVPLVGGMALDESGWLLSQGSSGEKVLIFSLASNDLVATAMDGEVWQEHGWMGLVGTALQAVPEYREIGIQLYARAALSDFLDRCRDPMLGISGTKDFSERVDGVTWRPYEIEPNLPGARLDSHWAVQLAYFAPTLYEQFFAEYVYVENSIYREEGGLLYVRDDAGELTEWGWRMEEGVEGLTIVEHSDDRMVFTVRGYLGDQSRLLQFTLENGLFTEVFEPVADL